jgi:uncharacterized membrane protein required for colicin V production
MNFLDWLIVIILAVSAWKGYRKGAVSILSGILGLFLGLAAALTYSRPLAYWAEEQYQVTTALAGWISEKLPQPKPAAGGQLSSPVPEWLLPGSWQDKLAGVDPALWGQILAEGMAGFLVKVLAFLVVVLLALAIFKLGGRLITSIVTGTLLGSLNRAAGLVAGLAINILLLALFWGIIGPFLLTQQESSLKWMQELSLATKESRLIPQLAKAYTSISSHLAGLW